MRNLVLIKLNGGLGNQMFQYAVAYTIALQYNSTLVLDHQLFKLTKKKPGHTPRRFELEIFGIDHRIATKEDIQYFQNLSLKNKIRRKLCFNYPKLFSEKNFEYQHAIEEALPPVYLKGFFQSYKYFESFSKEIYELFLFPPDKLNSENKVILKKIGNTQSVSVHIRRGDYVQDNITQQFHGNCSLGYYTQAISEMVKQNKEVEFFFFSDDMEWVEDQFNSFDIRKTFVTSNRGNNSWIDMFLMSKCEHNIIANSSFSWWAAWLNKNDKKIVISPKQWFRNPDKAKLTHDLIPHEWMRL